MFLNVYILVYESSKLYIKVHTLIETPITFLTHVDISQSYCNVDSLNETPYSDMRGEYYLELYTLDFIDRYYDVVERWMNIIF